MPYENRRIIVSKRSFYALIAENFFVCIDSKKKINTELLLGRWKNNDLPRAKLRRFSSPKKESGDNPSSWFPHNCSSSRFSKPKKAFFSIWVMKFLHKYSSCSFFKPLKVLVCNFFSLFPSSHSFFKFRTLRNVYGFIFAILLSIKMRVSSVVFIFIFVKVVFDKLVNSFFGKPKSLVPLGNGIGMWNRWVFSQTTDLSKGLQVQFKGQRTVWSSVLSNSEMAVFTKSNSSNCRSTCWFTIKIFILTWQFCLSNNTKNFFIKTNKKVYLYCLKNFQSWISHGNFAAITYTRTLVLSFCLGKMH